MKEEAFTFCNFMPRLVFTTGGAFLLVISCKVAYNTFCDRRKCYMPRLYRLILFLAVK